VTFDIDMDETTINDSTFVANSRLTGLHQGAITYDSLTRTATLNPTVDFEEGELVSVVLTTGIESSEGISIYRSYVWSFTVIASDASGMFAPQSTYATDYDPYSIFAADFDNDGDIDLASSDFAYSKVTVLLNNGNGTFSGRIDYGAGYRPIKIFGSDLDSDGDIDLMTTNRYDNNISVLLNNGNGTFASQLTYATDVTPEGIYSGDFDADGHLDVVVSNRNSGKVSVLMNNGDGTFGSYSIYATGAVPVSVYSADLDGDGYLDLMTSNLNTSDVSILLNNGDGTFGAHMDYAVGSSHCVTAADLDGDAYLDVISLSSGNVSILFNNGDGTFGSPSLYGVGSGPNDVFAADLDGDGDLDLATSNEGSSNLSVILNNGDGTFGPNATYPAGYRPISVLAADFDGDGDLDLAAADYWYDYVSVLLNLLPGSIEGTVYDEEANPIESALVIADGTIIGDTTDINGQYFLDRLGEGLHNISFLHPIYRDTTVLDVVVAAYDTTSLDMVMTLPGAVSGFVHDEGAAPVEGMYVYADGTSIDDTTDINGEYLLDDLDVGIYDIIFTHPDYRDTTIFNISVTRGDTTALSIVMELDLPGVITGVVSDSSIFPIEGVYIVATGNTPASDTTDINGDYMLHNLEVGYYDVSFSIPYYRDTTVVNVWVTAGDTITLDLVMEEEPPGWISGIVRDTSSTPIEDVYVIAINTLTDDSTDINGAYLLDSLEIGAYDILFSHPAYRDTTVMGVSVTSNDTTLLDVVLNEFPRVLSVFPENNELNVLPNINISVTFDIDMDSASINDSTFLIHTLYSGYHSGTITYDSSSRTTIFDPVGEFGYGEVVSVMATSRILSSVGVPLDVGYVWYFNAIVGGGTATFNPRSIYPVADYPVAVTAGDFDSDGDIDVAASNSGSSSGVTVLLNNGDGTFAPYSIYPVGTAPLSVATSDIDLDNDLDILAANNGSNSISVLTNNGNGTFSMDSIYAVAYQPDELIMTDLNGDGYQDITVRHRYITKVATILNNGDGTFGNEVLYATGGSNTQSMAVGDLDYDGDIDIVAGNTQSPSNIGILLNNGSGEFELYSTYLLDDSPPDTICAADLNGDGYLDLAITEARYDSLILLFNNYDSTFSNYMSYPIDRDITSVIAADLDADGDLDLAGVSLNDGSPVIFSNNGDGTFAPYTTFSVGDYPYSIFSADFDGDGSLDLVVPNLLDNTVSILLNYVPGSISGVVTDDQLAPIEGIYVKAIGTTMEDTTDINGEYSLDSLDTGTYDIYFSHADYRDTTVEDIIVSQGVTLLDVVMQRLPKIIAFSPELNELNVSVNTNISVTFDTDMDESTINDSTFVVSAVHTGVHSGDVSYDSLTRTAVFDPISNFDRGEIVSVTITPGIEPLNGAPFDKGFVWLFTTIANNGTATFEPHINYSVGNGPLSVCIAEIDNDNDLDLATANMYSNNISVLKNNGDGTFTSHSTYPIGDSATSVCASDFNRDGFIDVAAANSASDNVSVLLNNGNGTFASHVAYAVNLNPQHIIASDLNCDGYFDLATANKHSNDVSVLLNDGDGTFASYTAYSVGNVPTSIYAADLDNDGDLELITANSNTDDISILWNDGGAFASDTSYSVGDEPVSIFAADLNGDGYLDLTTANYVSSDVSILLNNGNGTFASNFDYPSADTASSVFAVDLDGDGDLDLAIACAGADSVSILLNNGDGTFGSYSTFQVGVGPMSIYAGDLDDDGDLDLVTANYNTSNVSVLINEGGGCEYVTGDVNGSDSYNGLDITYGVNFFKYGTPEPQCPYGSCPVPSCDAFFYCGDVNASCNYNGLDITYGVNYFKFGSPAPNPCGDCPPAGDATVTSVPDQEEKPTVINRSKFTKNILKK
jgi:hypothetical protein